MTNEPVYMKGWSKAFDYVWGLNEKGLLEQIDALYGRDRLSKDYTSDELRQEAYRQTKLDWLNPSHPAYQSLRKNLEHIGE